LIKRATESCGPAHCGNAQSQTRGPGVSCPARLFGKMGAYVRGHLGQCSSRHRPRSLSRCSRSRRSNRAWGWAVGRSCRTLATGSKTIAGTLLLTAVHFASSTMMNKGMASCVQRNQVLFGIVTALAAKLVVNLQI